MEQLVYSLNLNQKKKQTEKVLERKHPTSYKKKGKKTSNLIKNQTDNS